ncbi:helix-turn-helix domain-containing protein [Sphingomonas morindae]|uniref:Helix-turn-helix transcriptional regulator n=1 Tax=Sphingomonas morindae TaxID=1541170 RepID=A0ABY4X3H9_9SPHN|nr:helix-turn-helix transcriptional regulator [Sphingomonas morindae]USI71459.1 helix-turn-helix transcriptional regulator [Sphingomonas morindae]
MITRIRDVRRAKGLTLADVAARCTPPTTAQTIGRLETGTRTVSVAWLNRIAAALGVAAADLVQLPESADLPVAAVLGAAGAAAPRRSQVAVPPRPHPGAVALLVETSLGDYRAGDTLWLDRLAPAEFDAARNRDVLVPLPAGRFLFGRLLALAPDGLDLLPLGAAPGGPQRLAPPPWLGRVTCLIRLPG